MKLKDLMPITNEQILISKVENSNKKNVSEKRFKKSKIDKNSEHIMNIYHQVILNGYEKLKRDELDLLQMIIFCIEHDPEYTPSTSVADFAESVLRNLNDIKQV